MTAEVPMKIHLRTGMASASTLSGGWPQQWHCAGWSQLPGTACNGPALGNWIGIEKSRVWLKGSLSPYSLGTYLCLSLDDWVWRMTGIAGFPWKQKQTHIYIYIHIYIHIYMYILCFVYINGLREQYIQVGIIFNYMFHVGLPGKCL